MELLVHTRSLDCPARLSLQTLDVPFHRQMEEEARSGNPSKHERNRHTHGPWEECSAWLRREVYQTVLRADDEEIWMEKKNLNDLSSVILGDGYILRYIPWDNSNESKRQNAIWDKTATFIVTHLLTYKNTLPSRNTGRLLTSHAHGWIEPNFVALKPIFH